jgi:hypothetical protein
VPVVVVQSMKGIGSASRSLPSPWGREQKSGEAIALLGVDESIAPAALAELPRIRQVKALRF